MTPVAKWLLSGLALIAAGLSGGMSSGSVVWFLLFFAGMVALLVSMGVRWLERSGTTWVP